jgi:hypothetical protein
MAIDLGGCNNIPDLYILDASRNPNKEQNIWTEICDRPLCLYRRSSVSCSNLYNPDRRCCMIRPLLREGFELWLTQKYLQNKFFLILQCL